MNIALLCTGEIGLQALYAISHFEWVNVRAVFSYRSEPWNHSFEKTFEYCNARAIPVAEGHRVGESVILRHADIDYMICVKWHYLIPADIVAALKKDLIIFHASLLPKYRGFAPVNWPLINGEEVSGVTMFYGAEEVDAGDIIDQMPFEITMDDTVATVERKVTDSVVQLLQKNLPLLYNGTATRMPQDHREATYCIWRSPEDGLIDWNWSAVRIFNFIRGLTRPGPGAFTYLCERKLFIWRATIVTDRRYVGVVPGKVERICPGNGVNVLTGDGILCLHEVQLEGESAVVASDVVNRLKTRLG